MGLLTNTENSRRLTRLITDYGSIVGCCTYILSLIIFIGLFHPLFWEKTYFSENALLPGLVKSDYNPGFREVSYYYEKYISFISNTPVRPDQTQDISRGLSWIRGQLQGIGMEVYTQAFTHKPADHTETYNGTNVYGIIRAPRAASTECIVIVIPTTTDSSNTRSDYTEHTGTNDGAVGLVLSMSQQLVRQNHWAKDIILLFSDHGLTGVRLWLEAYHGTSDDILPAVAGAIQAAIGLQLKSDMVNSVDVKYFGMEGQLVNLDLFNTVIRLCKREQVLCTINNRADSSQSLKEYDKMNYLMKTALSGLMTQAAGKITGAHSLFLPYHIEAVTLSGVTGGQKQHGYISVGRVLEGVLRSLNNLLERLHHSFFFYFLPSTDLYISIGMYTVPFIIIMLTPILQIAKLWFEVTQSTVGDRVIYTLPSIAGVIPMFLVCQLVGVVFYLSPAHVGEIGGGGGILPAHFAFSLISVFVISAWNYSTPISNTSWKVFKMFSILWYCVVLVNLFVHNFPLAWFILVLTAPGISFIPLPNTTPSKLYTLPLVLLSPVVFLVMYCYIFHTDISSIFDVNFYMTNAIFDVVDHAEITLHAAYIQYLEFNRNTYFIYCCVVYPMWLLFWGLHTSKINNE